MTLFNYVFVSLSLMLRELYCKEGVINNHKFKGLTMNTKYESAEEAIRAAIIQSGKQMKEVATKLWPAIKMESALARLQNSLNPERAEKLTIDEVILICKLCNRIDPIIYITRAVGYEPIPINPDDERTKLMRELKETQRRAQSIMEELEQLDK